MRKSIFSGAHGRESGNNWIRPVHGPGNNTEISTADEEKAPAASKWAKVNFIFNFSLFST